MPSTKRMQDSPARGVMVALVATNATSGPRLAGDDGEVPQSARRRTGAGLGRDARGGGGAGLGRDHVGTLADFRDAAGSRRGAGAVARPAAWSPALKSRQERGLGVLER
jgi:hypothetical protein